MSNYSCFDNLIGLRGSCDCANPISGLFVNDLPGITLRRLSKTANEEHTRGETYFKRLHQEAANEVALLFQTKIGEYFMFNHILDRKVVGKVGEDFPDYPVQHGFEINCWNQEKYISTHIESICFRAKNEGKAKLWIHTDCQQEEHDIIVTCGRNEFKLDTKIQGTGHIILDPCIWIADKVDCACGGNCGCDYSCGNFNIVPIKRESEYKDPKSAWKRGGQGVQLVATVRADDTDLMCQFARDLAPAIRLMIGIKLMEEALVSDNISPLIRNGKEDAERLLVLWRGGVNAITGFEEKSKFNQLLQPACQKAAQYMSHIHSPVVQRVCHNEAIQVIP